MLYKLASRTLLKQKFLVNSLLSRDTFYIVNFLFVHFNSVSSSISTQSSSAHVEERDP